MTVYGWTWLIVTVVSWRYIAGFVWAQDSDYRKVMRNKKQGGHVAFAVIVGGMLSMIWFITFPALAGWWLFTEHSDLVRRALIYEPSRHRREEQLKESRRRTAQLERELNL